MTNEEHKEQISHEWAVFRAVARFSAILVKKDGEWYLQSVRDSVVRPPSNAEHLESLEWLIGEWTGEAEKGESAKASYDWAENQNFIVSSFATTLDGVPVVGGTQWIGWDSVDKQVRSWSFMGRRAKRGEFRDLAMRLLGLAA